MPGYKPSPTIITGGTGTGNIKQTRRIKGGHKPKRRKRRSGDILKKLGVI